MGFLILLLQVGEGTVVSLSIIPPGSPHQHSQPSCSISAVSQPALTLCPLEWQVHAVCAQSSECEREQGFLCLGLEAVLESDHCLGKELCCFLLSCTAVSWSPGARLCGLGKRSDSWHMMKEKKSSSQVPAKGCGEGTAASQAPSLLMGRGVAWGF